MGCLSNILKKQRVLLALTFLLSLFIHLSVIVADVVYLWADSPERAETALRSTDKKLKSQKLEETTKAALRGVQKASGVSVILPSAWLAARTLALEAEATQAAAQQKQRLRREAEAKQAAQKKAKAVKAAKASAVSQVVARVQQQAVPAKVNKPLPVQASGAPAEQNKMAAAPVEVAEKKAASQVANAARPDMRELARFPRDVNIRYRWGLYTADMHWHVANGEYKLSIEGSGLGLAYRYFESRGRADAAGVRPERFVEHRDRDHETPKYLVEFDYATREVEVGEPGKRKIEKMSAVDHDIFSAAFHLALTGADLQQSLMSVYSGRRRYEDVKFGVAGEATLELSNKPIEAVLVRGAWKDRRFEFWLAPQWNNILVRIDVVVPEYGSFDFWAEEISLDGKKVLEWIPPESQGE